MASVALRIFLLITAFTLKVCATGQQSDRLIYKGDTFELLATPLELYSKIDSLRPLLFGKLKACESTACGNGYTAEWIVMQDQLYLNGIFSCCYSRFNTDGIKADLKKLFGTSCVNGKVKIDWLTANLLSPKGEQIYHSGNAFDVYYRGELEFQFQRGHLTRTLSHNYPKAKRSAYSADQEKLKQFIYSHIQWTSLPQLDRPVTVSVRFSGNEEGVVDSARVSKGNVTVLDSEALRVIKLIPAWDVLYRYGKQERLVWFFSIVFSEANREKYSEK